MDVELLHHHIIVIVITISVLLIFQLLPVVNKQESYYVLCLRQ